MNMIQKLNQKMDAQMEEMKAMTEWLNKKLCLNHFSDHTQARKIGETQPEVEDGEEEKTFKGGYQNRDRKNGEKNGHRNGNGRGNNKDRMLEHKERIVEKGERTGGTSKQRKHSDNVLSRNWRFNDKRKEWQ